MAYSNLRGRDTSVEKEIGAFLDEKFYKEKVSDFRRFENVDDQMKGKDVQFSLGGLKNIIVDEKATSHYINKDIPTFAFEIDFLRGSGDLTPGWLLDDDKQTQYYLLIWPFATNNWNPKKEDITKLKCLLISRRKLLNYLEDEGFSKDVLHKKSAEIRRVKPPNPIDQYKHKFIYFFFSTQLAEQPVNIIVRRDKLVELAEFRFEVSR